MEERLSIVRNLARLEKTICRVTKTTAFFDELHDFYEEEIDGHASNSIEKCKDLASLRLLT